MSSAGPWATRPARPKPNHRPWNCLELHTYVYVHITLRKVQNSEYLHRAVKMPYICICICICIEFLPSSPSSSCPPHLLSLWNLSWEVGSCVVCETWAGPKVSPSTCIHPSIHPSWIYLCLFTYLSVCCLPVFLSVCLAVLLSVYLHIYLCICSSVSLSICLSIYVCVCLVV